MKQLFAALLTLPLLGGCAGDGSIRAKVSQSPHTFCNPINLNYRFMVIEGGEGIREAADPVVLPYKGRYYLFASKSSGYWHTTDFTHYTQVIIPDGVLPIEAYAPALFVHNDYLYYVGSSSGMGMLYRSNAPEKGEWEAVKQIPSHWDPAFWVEGDSLYLYHGSSPTTPLRMQVLNLATLEPASELMDCFNSDIANHGWERTGEHNELPRRPYLEGAWMTKHNNKYYLQYATPGTEWKTYADGVYVADSPIGPFTYMENSPVSYKPSGFMGGAGHGCLFTTPDNRYWKAATNAISVRHMFERRLSFFPAGFDSQGQLYTNTYQGDLPLYLPNGKESAAGSNTPGWQLLSYKKEVTASSALPDYPVEQAVDEEGRTAWVAATNGTDEWYQVDLGAPASIAAIQVNFDEYGATQRGYVAGVYQSYQLEASPDGKQWSIVADFGTKRTDTPHDYIEFEAPFEARFVRFRNVAYTLSANLSLRDLRIFGLGSGDAPEPVAQLSVIRNETDGCKALLQWNDVPEADGYIVRYGTEKDKLYNSYQVMEDNTLSIGSLNKGVTYYFTVDAFNENGRVEAPLVVALN